MACWVLFPSQLFDTSILLKSILENVFTIILLEDPVFFGFRQNDNYGTGKPLKFNKLKIAYTKATCGYFYDYLKSKLKNKKILYYDFDALHKLPETIQYSLLKKYKEIHLFNPCDNLLINTLKKSKLNIVIHDSPQWLCSETMLDIFIKEKVKKEKLYHSSFYQWMKSRSEFKDIHDLQNTKSLDKENRKPITDDAKAKIPISIEFNSNNHKKHIKEAIEWTNHHRIFSKNPGPDDKKFTSILLEIPITHEEAYKFLDDFIKNKFTNFGEFEDAFIPTLEDSKRYMYHSGIAPLINNGLLTPRQVLEKVIEAWKKKSEIPKQSYEGFVRQILGWREYCRLYYYYFKSEQVKKNIWKTKALLPQYFYEIKDENNDNTDLVETIIKKAWNTGYLHHIERLMIMSNWMTLNSISPDAAYDWFFEFSLDSYSWVMVFNVYSMGTWSDGGLAMRKPYISSSSYLRKMGKLKKDELNKKEWDEKYKSFVQKNKSILKHTLLANLV